MSLITIGAVTVLAAACHVPGVKVERIVAAALVESRYEPLAIQDNTAHRIYHPSSPVDAVRLVSGLTVAGHSVDAGLMQVNSANWPRLGLTPDTVFDPQVNICAGARVLGEAMMAERRVSCRYNTGRPDCPPDYPDRIDRALGDIPVTAVVQAEPLCPPPDPDGWQTLPTNPDCPKDDPDAP